MDLRWIQFRVHIGPKASALRYLANAIPSKAGCCILDDRLEIVHDIAVTCSPVLPLWYDHKRRRPTSKQTLEPEFLADAAEHAQHLRELRDDLRRCRPDQTQFIEGAEERRYIQYVCGPAEALTLAMEISGCW